MKVQTLVFSCDKGNCSEEFVANSCDEVLGVVRLTKAGWSIQEHGHYRKHYCPKHTGDPA